MAKPKNIVSETTQNQQSWNDFARSKKHSEAGFRTALGISPSAAAVDVPAWRPLLLVNTGTTVRYLARAEDANDAPAPSSITTSHVAVPPNSSIIWNSGEPSRSTDLVSIRTSHAELAVYIAQEDLS